MTFPREDRLRVQTLLGKNMVVEAGAGTGKTTLLIDRLCFAVLAQGVPAEKLVALTFTEKAAAEIKTRLIFKLQRVAESVRQGTADRTLDLLRSHFDVPDEEIVARAETALSKLDRSFISTIHSFCADILKKYPLEAGLTPNAEIDTGVKAARLFDAAWNRFLDEELGPSAPRAQQWKEALAQVTLDEIKAFAQELCGGKIERYDYFAHKDFLAKVCLQKADRAEALSTAYMEGVKKPRSAEKWLVWSAAQLRRTAAFLKGENIPPSPEEEAGEFPKKPLKGWEPDAFEEAAALTAFAQKATAEKQRLFLLVYNLVETLVDDVRRRREQEGILSFDDLIVKTRNLLQCDLRVRRELKEDFSVLFIDEFQDTDPVQGELLLFLAEEKLSSASSWRQIKLEPGKLFVVGDPKQSIYRFRGADITAYELFTELILRQGGEKFFLQKNFRSEADIIAFANGVCGAVMRQEASFQPAYVPIFTDKPARPAAVELALVRADNSDAPPVEDCRHNQARFIANWIKQHVGALTLADGRKLDYKDIALLTRASTTAGPYVDALRRAGIPFNLEEDRNFYRNQEISDFLNLLRVIDNPDDKIALAGVLRSPLGGRTDEELYQISKRGELSVFARPQDGELASFYALLRGFVSQAGRLPLKDLLQEVLYKTFLSESCAAAYRGEQSWANLEKIAALAEGYSAGTPSSLGQFLARVQELMEEDLSALSASPAAEALSAVSVMTVHKSKGLEFPIIIWADVSKRESSGGRTKPAHIFSWQYNMHGLRAGNLCDVNLAFLEEEQQKHERAEEIRILYVALTRAKEKLVLVGNAQEETKTPAASFARAGLFPDRETCPSQVVSGGLTVPVTYIPYAPPAEFIYQSGADAPRALSACDEQAWRAAYQKRREAYERVKAQTRFLSPSGLVQAEQPAVQWEDSPSVELGSVCHKALELYVRATEKDVRAAVAQACGRLGAPQLQKEAEELLLPWVQSAAFKDALDGKVLACEMPFSFLQEDGNILSGIMDLVVQKPDGTVLVADYKTDKAVAGKEDAVFEKYRPQLAAYRAAARKIFNTPRVRCAALFVRTFASIDL